MGEVPLSESIWVPSAAELEKEQEWIRGKVAEIGEEKLIELAVQAAQVRENAYAPYSGYKVGAVILSQSGNVYQGCNSEAVTYTETIHGEAAAISAAIGSGEVKNHGRKFIKAAVVSHDGESGPCGGCRGRILEHCDNALVIDADGTGNIQRITSLNTLLTYAFGPSHLGIE